MGRKLKRQCRLSTSTWWLRLAGVSGASSYWNDLLHCPFWQLRTLLADGGGSDFRFFIFGSVRFDGDDVRSWWRVWRAYNTSEWNELCANAPYRIEQKNAIAIPIRRFQWSRKENFYPSSRRDGDLRNAVSLSIRWEQRRLCQFCVCSALTAVSRIRFLLNERQTFRFIDPPVCVQGSYPRSLSNIFTDDWRCLWILFHFIWCVPVACCYLSV